MRALVVDGGKATRLKGYPPPKGLVQAGDAPLLLHLVRRLREIGVDRVTVLIGYTTAARLLQSPVARRVDIEIDYCMEGPVAALCAVADKYRDEDVVITTGDAWFEHLRQLRHCSEGKVLALTDDPEAERPQIQMAETQKITYVGRFLKRGAVSYAGILRVNHCPKFWAALEMGKKAGMQWISRPLCFMPKEMVELRPVVGRSVNVNTVEDLVKVREAVCES